MSRALLIFSNNFQSQYLKSIQPILKDQEYEKVETLACDFQQGIGNKLQRYLHLKSWWSENYVTDWWEKYVYLSNRAPLLINSNVYVVDHVNVHPTKLQSARAAYLIHALLHCGELIKNEQLDPVNNKIIDFT